MVTKVGIVGLNATSWASWSHHPALVSPALSKDFTITALCTSSKASAEAACKHYNLPLSKAYDDAAAMARDPDVDLVVVSVKVPYHKKPVMDAIDAGKDVFCEWPLGQSLEEAEEMAAAAAAKGVKNMVGLQGRKTVVFEKAKALIEDGEIGEVRTAVVQTRSDVFANAMIESLAYLNDVKNGANSLTISVCHNLDTLCYILSAEFQSLSATTSTRLPEIPLITPSGDIKPGVRTSPDEIILHGVLTSGVHVSLHEWPETGNKESMLYWRIVGSNGYLEFRGSTTVALADHEPKLFIRKYGGVGEEEGEEREVTVQKDGNNIVGMYKGIVGAGGAKVQKYPTFADAVVRHRMIEAIKKSSQTGARVGYDSAVRH